MLKNIAIQFWWKRRNLPHKVLLTILVLSDFWKPLSHAFVTEKSQLNNLVFNIAFLYVYWRLTRLNTWANIFSKYTFNTDVQAHAKGKTCL